MLRQKSTADRLGIPKGSSRPWLRDDQDSARRAAAVAIDVVAVVAIFWGLHDAVTAEGATLPNERLQIIVWTTSYIEFGANRIARVDADFFSGPKPTGSFHAPSEALRAAKEQFGSSRRARWFGR